jgi:DeoR/GlpR family transcriptional regulator of sugar metabolism
MAKKPQAESDAIRFELFKILYAKYGQRGFHLAFSDIASAFQIDARTASQAVYDIIEFSAALHPDPHGVTLKPQSYYQENLASEPETKKRLAAAFLAEMKANTNNTNRVHALACGNGTTVTSCVRVLLPERDLYNVLITSNLGIIESQKGGPIYNLTLCGGVFKSEINGCVGSQAVRTFEDSRCEAALIGVSGINTRGELFVRYSEETEVLKQIANSTTSHIYVVASAKKLSQEDTFKFLDIRDTLERKANIRFTIITSPFQELDTQEKKDKAEVVYNKLKEMDKKVKVVMAS